MSGSPWSGNGKPVIGDSVRAYVSKILPKKMALEHFPGGDGTAILEGVVTDNTDARGLGIEWKLPNDSAFKRSTAQRILLRAVGATDAPEPCPTSTESKLAPVRSAADAADAALESWKAAFQPLAHEHITNKYDDEQVAALRDRGTGVKRGGGGGGGEGGGGGFQEKEEEGER